LARIDKDINKAIELLTGSDLIGIPTETVYGLAGNALDALAVAKIFEVKERPTFDPLIVHTSSIDRLADYVTDIPEEVHKLSKHFWPGPLTMIFGKKAIIPDLVTSGLDTVAVRIPNHPITLELLKRLDFPLAAPSANPFGYISPTNAMHVDEQLGDKIKYILDGGPCEVGIESTIVSFHDVPTVLRLGGCDIEQIESIIGNVSIQLHSTSNPTAPGMLESHYAPLTSIQLGNIDQLIEENADKKIGILSFRNRYMGIKNDRQYVLSEKGNIEEAATRLFTGLRHLDALNLQLILSEYVPEVGLGRAINDRLRRAEAKRN